MYPTQLGRFVDPENTVTHFHLREGDVVADFGAGSGAYLKPLSSAVGLSGIVYACEIQKNLVDALGTKAAEQRLNNIRPVWCDIEAPGGTKFNDGTLDAGLLSNILFQFVRKDTALTEVARVLRKGGKLFVIDWTDSFGGLGPRPEDVFSETDARSLLEQAGFSCEGTFSAGDHHYGLLCHKK
ncbi:class I SAM-dependent methyltransferase [Candidatus Kaiserbacteria bacterium]|nr:MAG: class I SAM-dependent methyltransferase [Candidatus Kaiserbacteria bacterium]